MTFVMGGLRMALATLLTNVRTGAAATTVHVQVDTESAVHVRHLLHHSYAAHTLKF